MSERENTKRVSPKSEESELDRLHNRLALTELRFNECVLELERLTYELDVQQKRAVNAEQKIVEIWNSPTFRLGYFFSRFAKLITFWRPARKDG